ncbi:MAG: DNA repair protein RadA [Dehalococcoidia bacterium]|nr:DNA repair protein RadA [Dehalococcoidia bacterium]
MKRSKFVCQECGNESIKWLGRCPDCGGWSTFVEVVESSKTSSPLSRPGSGQAPVRLPQVPQHDFHRIPVSISEFHRVLGGGIVPGSLVLIGGDPGIGKSTLLLQLADSVAASVGSVLYVSGEESLPQIAMRAQRMGISRPEIHLMAESSLDEVVAQAELMRPGLLIIDSIQSVALQSVGSATGSLTQVRECGLRLLNLAKGTGLPVFLAGHVTKEGVIAGPRVLEHMVDTVLYLEGERFQSFRVLRAVKNRFGSTNEVGIFEMRSGGFEEVLDPASSFLSMRSPHPIGSALTVAVEGTRPILVEIQALTSRTVFGLPRRTANGVEFSRLLMISAVLSRRAHVLLYNQDIFVNVVGGLQIDEPAADLALAVAIASSQRNAPVDPGAIFLGEVGLGNELRGVSQIERRLDEARRLGFESFIVPRTRDPLTGNGVRPVGTVEEALAIALGPREPEPQPGEEAE